MNLHIITIMRAAVIFMLGMLMLMAVVPRDLCVEVEQPTVIRHETQDGGDLVTLCDDSGLSRYSRRDQQSACQRFKDIVEENFNELGPKDEQIETSSKDTEKQETAKTEVKTAKTEVKTTNSTDDDEMTEMSTKQETTEVTVSGTKPRSTSSPEVHDTDSDVNVDSLVRTLLLDPLESSILPNSSDVRRYKRNVTMEDGEETFVEVIEAKENVTKGDHDDRVPAIYLALARPVSPRGNGRLQQYRRKPYIKRTYCRRMPLTNMICGLSCENQTDASNLISITNSPFDGLFYKDGCLRRELVSMYAGAVGCAALLMLCQCVLLFATFIVGAGKLKHLLFYRFLSIIQPLIAFFGLCFIMMDSAAWAVHYAVHMRDYKGIEYPRTFECVMTAMVLVLTMLMCLFHTDAHSFVIFIRTHRDEYLEAKKLRESSKKNKTNKAPKEEKKPAKVEKDENGFEEVDLLSATGLVSESSNDSLYNREMDGDTVDEKDIAPRIEFVDSSKNNRRLLHLDD